MSVRQEPNFVRKRRALRPQLTAGGPAELNDVRRAGSFQRRREAAVKTHANIERLLNDSSMRPWVEVL